MKFSIILILYFSVSSLIMFGYAEGNISYECLVESVSHKYGSNGIVMAKTVNYDALETMTIIHNRMRHFSANGIQASFIDLKQLRERLKFYSNRVDRPLVVISIHEMTEIQIFKDDIANIDMSYPIWLLIFTGDNNEDICQFCRNPIGNPFNLKFNSEMLISCCDSEYIEEWWCKTENHTSVLPRARLLDESNGIEWYSNESLYILRKTIDKSDFRIVLLEKSRFAWMKDNELRGFLGETFTELAQRMNFSISNSSEEKNVGSWDPITLESTGIIGRLVQREADVGVFECVMSSERMNLIEFTVPIFRREFYLFIRKPDGTELHWNAYLKVFSPEIWMAIITLLLATPVLLTIIRYRRNMNLFNMVCEHYLNVWAIFCQQGVPEIADSAPLRILYISLFISAMVLYAVYSGTLTSFLATSTAFLPFHNLEEFVNDGTYKLTMLKDGVTFYMFKNSDDKLMRKMMALMKPTHSLPTVQTEIFKEVCSEKVALFAMKSFKWRMRQHIPCEIASVGTGMFRYLGIILPPQSAYTKWMNYHIQKLSESGILYNLERKASVKNETAETTTYKPVRFWGILPILTVFGIGVLISMIVYIIERARIRKRRRQVWRSLPHNSIASKLRRYLRMN